MTRNRRQFPYRRVEQLRVFWRLTHPDIQDNFGQARRLMNVAEVKLLDEFGSHYVHITLLQSRRRDRLCSAIPLTVVCLLALVVLRHTYALGIAWPDLTLMRSATPSLSRFRLTRVGSPDFGSSNITFDASIIAGNSMIPLSSPSD